MKRLTPIALSLVAAVASATPLLAKDAPGLQVGKLTCAVTEKTSFIVGSTATLGCNFKPATGGAVQYYTGSIKDYGIDIGSVENATLVWGVLAPSADMQPGALEGTYGGVTAGASLGAGLEANALVGGFDKSIALNPLSIQGETGTNITLGVSKLTLKLID
jgi:hypothetical protein